MVWPFTRSSEPKLPDGPTRLPDYFPVEPKGCEKHAQNLFLCLNNEAVAKARDMEKAGLQTSYFPDVIVKPESEQAAKLVQQQQEQQQSDGGAAVANPDLPKAGDNPLDECKTPIAYYVKCCDKELKKRQNWILTEPYRVQEEYRYSEKTTN